MLFVIKLVLHCFLAIVLSSLIYQLFFYETNQKPIILWWTPFLSTQDRVIDCSQKPFRSNKCLVTVNRSLESFSLAFLFYGSHLTYYDFPLPRDNSVIWGLYHEESPKNFPALLYPEVQRLFNVTATFSQYSNMPLVLQYLDSFHVLTDERKISKNCELDTVELNTNKELSIKQSTLKRDMEDIRKPTSSKFDDNNSDKVSSDTERSFVEKKYVLKVEEKNFLLNDLGPALYIQSNCDTINNRDIIISELMKFIKVDSYGDCLNNRRFPKSLADVDPLDIYNKHLMNFIAKYKFIISFENAVCEDYITEKLWRPLIVGSIPIYLGSPSVQDWLPNTNSAILVTSFNSLKSLADYIKQVNENDTLYNSYLEHKLMGQISNKRLKSYFRNKAKMGNDILNFECFVCKKLHDIDKNVDCVNDFTSNKNIFDCVEPSEQSSWYYHWNVTKYQSKALIFKVIQNKPFTENEYEQYLLDLLKN